MAELLKKEATIHIRLDGTLRDQLTSIAESNNKKLSVVIREALEQYTGYTDNNSKILLDKF